MPAFLIKIHPLNPQENKLRDVIKVLTSGGIIIYPTDTVYGLGCDIHNQRAVERICKIKKINPSKINLSFICYDLSHIAEYTKNLSTATFKIMKKALPGPYTFILQASNRVPKILFTNKSTVGIRVPDHNIPRTLVNMLGNPILTTSVKHDDNVLEYGTNPEEIFDQYKHLVDLVIDGGPGNNVPSTVVDCTDEAPRIIRQGAGIIEEIL